MSSRDTWRTVFLGSTALIIGMELWASFDGNPETEPWTDLIVTYVPGEVTTGVLAGLAIWLCTHFGLRYRRKNRASKSPETSTDTTSGDGARDES